ncbi:YL1-domain-containing protein [Agrocybe pediades]|nr:YL1-domain-containing protein [Agrocybe pediades]
MSSGNMEAMAAEEPTEMLVARRSKRSTAGNRMEAALAEMALEDSKDLDDDKEFVNDKVEEDEFGSDFQSTDEEAEQETQDVGEAEVINEERRERRAKRSKLEKATAAAHQKHKATFNPDVQVQSSVVTRRAKAKASQRVSLGPAVDAASGEVMHEYNATLGGKTRTSKRKHTVLSTNATVTRLKQTAAKKASQQPKKAKIEQKIITQAELIAQALDTEEGNIVEHRDYLKNEVKKRERAKVVRAKVEGPLIRWTSRSEEVKVLVPPPPPPPPPPAPVAAAIPSRPSSASVHRSVYGPPGSLFTPTTYSFSGGSTMVSTIATVSSPQPQISSTLTASQPSTTTFSYYQPYQALESSAYPIWQPPMVPPAQAAQPSAPISQPTPSPNPAPPIATAQSQNPAQESPVVTATSPPDAAPQVSQETPAAAPEPEYKMETQTKNYIVHELAQRKGHPKPTWMETMTAMFGDHVKWDEIKVFVGKNRPLSRPRQTCPITGRQAHYLDPRTNVPYADSHAYKVLTQLLQHEYVWNASLGCYMEHERPPLGSKSGKKSTTGKEDDAMSVDEDL